MNKVVYGKRSQAAFDTLDPRWQKVFTYIKDVLGIDHSLLEGHRGQERQDELFFADPPATHVRWPDSTHNSMPSRGVDAVPYVLIPGRRGGIHWHDSDPQIRELYYREMVRFATIVQMVALLVFDLETRWGGDWDKDWSLLDNKFNDYPHHEL
jgi:hypothetical protein